MFIACHDNHLSVPSVIRNRDLKFEVVILNKLREPRISLLISDFLPKQRRLFMCLFSDWMYGREKGRIREHTSSAYHTRRDAMQGTEPFRTKILHQDNPMSLIPYFFYFSTTTIAAPSRKLSERIMATMLLRQLGVRWPINTLGTSRLSRIYGG